MDYFAIIESAAQSGCLGVNGIKTPTEAQMKAGNYRMGRCEYKGLQLVFEQPRNSYREGTAKDGKKWRNRMAAHYGYLAGTKGADGDGIDIFVGSNPETDNIFVINQIDPATGSFDEHKVMIGFLGAADAKRAYQESYDADWRGFGDMVAMTLDQFKWWLKYGATKKPVSHKSLPYDGSLNMSEIQWDSAALPVNTDLAGLMYQLRTEDAGGLLLDSVTVADILEDAESVLALDALVVPMNMLDRKTKQLQNIMNMSGGSLSVSAMQLTAPFKNRGTTNIAAVYELSDGQTVSIFFHNPDSTPNRLTPTDDLVSWKWLLNKKDITLLVAPEKGQDLNPREVARRVMRLAEKNSARFAKANENRAARMANIASLKQQVETKVATLKGLEDEIEQVQAKLDDPTRAPAPGNSEPAPVPARSPEDESMIGFTAEDVANFGAKEAARRAAWFEKYGYEQHEKDPAFIALKKYLLKEFGTDVIENFAGGLVNGRDPIEVSIEQANERNRTEPTEQELYVHNQTIEGHNLLKALLYLGWTNESQSTRNKALWYVTRTILGGFKASANPEGRRRLSAKLENGQMKAEHGDNVLVSVPYDASKTPEQNAQKFNDAVSAIPGSGAEPVKAEVRAPYKPASEYTDIQTIKTRLAEIQQEELALTKKRAEMQESFTDYPDLKESLQREREELAARYKELKAAQAPATVSNPDRDYLNQVIAGEVDFMAPEVADQLVAIAEKYGDDAEMTALAEQAAEAYSAAVVEAAKSALGGEPAKKPDAGIANAKSSDYDIANANQESEQMSANTGDNFKTTTNLDAYDIK